MTAGEYQKMRRSKARVDGMCERCFCRARTSGVKCDKCRMDGAAIVRRLRARARENGMCGMCRNRRVSPGLKHCIECLLSVARRRKARAWCETCLSSGFHRKECK